MGTLAPKQTLRLIVAGMAFLLGSLGSTVQAAAVQVTYDLTTGSNTTVATEVGTGLGNRIDFYDPVSTYTMQTFAWSDVGGLTIEAGQVTQDN